MNRELIRILAAEKNLQLKTSQYLFANNKNELIKSVNTIGLPCIIKTYYVF